MDDKKTRNTQVIRLAIFALLSYVASACGLDHSRTKAQPEARYALGKGSAYPSEPLSEEERIAVQQSVLAQRQFAWRIVEKVVADVSPVEGSDMWVPRFSTWYARNDFERWFQSTYSLLTPEQRRTRVSLRPDMIDRGETHLIKRVLTSPSWPSARLNSWLAALDSREKWLGTMGTARALFSPSAIKHLLSSYKQISECDPLSKDEPTEACLRSDFPNDAVIVKAAWHRHGMNFPLPIYETSGHALTERLGPSGHSWDTYDRLTLTRPDQPGLMIKTSSGAEYQLTGLHIMSKESKDWVWITLWWSDTPGEDFGEDRPASLTGVWSHYKMCVVTDFDNSTSDLDDVRLKFPSLAAAMEAVMTDKNAGKASWCSNPYLEKGINNQKTNCIGCHQFAGTSEHASQIPASSDFPDFGRTRMLSSFASDYLWSITADPENLREKIRSRVSYHDTHD